MSYLYTEQQGNDAAVRTSPTQISWLRFRNINSVLSGVYNNTASAGRA